LVTRTNHNTIQTIGIYVRVFRTADHAGQIFIPQDPSDATVILIDRGQLECCLEITKIYITFR